jgi:hypothetical protein
MQHFLNRLPLPHGHKSLRPSFSSSSLSPCTIRTPRLTCVSDGNPLRRLLIVSKARPFVFVKLAHGTPPPKRVNVIKTISVLARSRTWSSTFAGSRANPAHPEDGYSAVRSSAPRRGVEPRLAASKAAVRSGTLARRFTRSIPTWTRSENLELRRLGHRRHGCRWSTIRYTIGTNIIQPLRADDWIRTSMSLFTRQAPFSVEPRRQARARGVEPRPPALETGCSPRSTLVCSPRTLQSLGRFVNFAAECSSTFH